MSWGFSFACGPCGDPMGPRVLGYHIFLDMLYMCHGALMLHTFIPTSHAHHSFGTVPPLHHRKRTPKHRASIHVFELHGIAHLLAIASSQAN